MKKLAITLITALTVLMSAMADGQDTLWLRYTAGAQDLAFTPDDKYVIAWTNAIEFWEVQQGVKEFSIPTETTGDFNYNNQFLVFAQDSTPKLLNWQTKEVVEGFEKEKENLGRIRTAKSKNEFMANTFHHDDAFGDIVGNTIYFYNIDTKSKVDSISFVKQFKKLGYKWKRTIHDYDYCGINDEFIYVVMDEVNDEIENIPPVDRERNYYVNFYSRETKELLDSVFVFQNTNKFYGGVNKLVVMNDRSKIAWNNKGGVINFFDIYTKQFYNRLVFDSSDYAEANDIELTQNDNYLSLAYGGYIKSYQMNNITNKYYFNLGTYHQCKLSNNFQYMVGSIGGILIMHPTTITGIEEVTQSNILNISPNPTANNIKIEITTENFGHYKLSLLDLNGNLVSIIKDETLNNSYQIINYDTQGLASGTYFIRLEIDNKIFTEKFIKE